MKISEILAKLDLSKKEKYYIDEDFLREFYDFPGVCDFDTNKLNIECIRIVTWYCTDTWVGTLVILLNDVPVCISNQNGRKCDEEFYWVSEEKYLQTKEIVEKAKIEKEPSISLINQEEEFGDDYQINFAGELILQFHQFAFYNNEKVSVEKIKSQNYIEQNVKITFENGKSEIVNLNQLKFPFIGLK